MVPEKTKLKAKAKTLGIEGYRTMGTAELEAAISAAEKGTNGSSTKGAANKAVKGAVKKGTAAVKGSATKGRAQVSAPATETPAKGKASKGSAATKGSTSSPANKSTSQKSKPAKGSAAKGEAKRTTSGTRKGATTSSRNVTFGRVGKGGYTNINRSAIDWTKESTVGQTGKRKSVLDSLRKHKGDYGIVFEELKENAPKWYPNAIKAYPTSKTKRAASERQLHWLIARVAYDYAYKTGQHEGRAKAKSSSTAKKSTSTKGAAKKTTAKKGAATKKAAPAAKKKTSTSKTKSTTKSSAKKSAVAKSKAAPARRGATKTKSRSASRRSSR